MPFDPTIGILPPNSRFVVHKKAIHIEDASTYGKRCFLSKIFSRGRYNNKKILAAFETLAEQLKTSPNVSQVKNFKKNIRRVHNQVAADNTQFKKSPVRRFFYGKCSVNLHNYIDLNSIRTHHRDLQVEASRAVYQQIHSRNLALSFSTCDQFCQQIGPIQQQLAKLTNLMAKGHNTDEIIALRASYEALEQTMHRFITEFDEAIIEQVSDTKDLNTLISLKSRTRVVSSQLHLVGLPELSSPLVIKNLEDSLKSESDRVASEEIESILQKLNGYLRKPTSDATALANDAERLATLKEGIHDPRLKKTINQRCEGIKDTLTAIKARGIIQNLKAKSAQELQSSIKEDMRAINALISEISNRDLVKMLAEETSSVTTPYLHSEVQRIKSIIHEVQQIRNAVQLNTESFQRFTERLAYSHRLVEEIIRKMPPGRNCNAAIVMRESFGAENHRFSTQFKALLALNNKTSAESDGLEECLNVLSLNMQLRKTAGDFLRDFPIPAVEELCMTIHRNITNAEERIERYARDFKEKVSREHKSFVETIEQNNNRFERLCALSSKLVNLDTEYDINTFTAKTSNESQSLSDVKRHLDKLKTQASQFIYKQMYINICHLEINELSKEELVSAKPLLIKLQQQVLRAITQNVPRMQSQLATHLRTVDRRLFESASREWKEFFDDEVYSEIDNIFGFAEDGFPPGMFSNVETLVSVLNEYIVTHNKTNARQLPLLILTEAAAKNIEAIQDILKAISLYHIRDYRTKSIYSDEALKIYLSQHVREWHGNLRNDLIARMHFDNSSGKLY